MNEGDEDLDPYTRPDIAHVSITGQYETTQVLGHDGRMVTVPIVQGEDGYYRDGGVAGWAIDAAHRQIMNSRALQQAVEERTAQDDRVRAMELLMTHPIFNDMVMRDGVLADHMMQHLYKKMIQMQKMEDRLARHRPTVKDRG